jgi:hypothetical protein
MTQPPTFAATATAHHFRTEPYRGIKMGIRSLTPRRLVGHIPNWANVGVGWGHTTRLASLIVLGKRSVTLISLTTDANATMSIHTSIDMFPMRWAARQCADGVNPCHDRI